MAGLDIDGATGQQTRVDQREQLGQIVDTGRRKTLRQENTGAIHGRLVFGATFVAVRSGLVAMGWMVPRPNGIESSSK